MTAAHYKGGHYPGNDLGLHYTALPPIVASCPYSDQLLVTRKFWSPGANRPSQAICGSGVGASVCANKIPGVRAALIHDHFSARQGVEDDHMNVLCMGGRTVGPAGGWGLGRSLFGARVTPAARNFR